MSDNIKNNLSYLSKIISFSESIRLNDTRTEKSQNIYSEQSKESKPQQV